MGRELQQREGQVADVNIKFLVDALRMMTAKTIRQPLYIPLPTCFSPTPGTGDQIFLKCVWFFSTNIFFVQVNILKLQGYNDGQLIIVSW